MPQTPVTEDQGTPIFDALAAEIGIEWPGRLEQQPDPDTATHRA